MVQLLHNLDFHQDVVDAIVGLTQLQIENSAPLFDVDAFGDN